MAKSIDTAVWTAPAFHAMMQPSMEPVLLYITAPDKPQANAIARALLEARLIACANILGGAETLYRWQGRVEHAAECLLLAKSVRAHLPALTTAVKAMHRYECPCIIAVPIIDGSPEFLAWIAEATV